MASNNNNQPINSNEGQVSSGMEATSTQQFVPVIQSLPHVEMLDGKNFRRWLDDIVIFAEVAGCGDLLYARHTNVSADRKPDLKRLKFRLLSFMKPEIREAVKNHDWPNQIIADLKRRFDRPNSLRLARIVEEIMNMKMKSTEELEVYLCRFDAKFLEAKNNGANIQEEIIVLILLNSLPPEMSKIKDAILDSIDDMDSVNLDNVKEKLRKKCARIKKNENIDQHQQAFASTSRQPVRNRNENIKCFNCGLEGHISRNCPNNNRRFNQPRYVTRSNESDNTRRERWSNVNPNVSNNNRNRRFASYAADPDNDNNESEQQQTGHAFTIIDNNDGKSTDWYVDSASSGHYVNNENQLDNKQSVSASVITANGQQCNVSSIGDLNMKTDNGFVMNMKQVECVPSFGKNLLSVPVSCDRGNIVIFDENKCIFLDKNNCNLKYNEKAVTLNVPRVGNAYVFKANKISSQQYISGNSMAVQQSYWHQRLGHPSIDKMRRILKNSKIDKFQCDECRLSKCVRTSHPLVKENYGFMQRISADLIGPLPESGTGHKFVLHLVEHHTSFGGVYTIKTKDESVKHVIEFIDYCENQTGQKLKEFLSDNGTEFVNYQLQYHLKRKGVEFVTTTPYTSQQNGKVERRNRTLMDCARTILKDSKLPNEFWPFAVNTANYLINRWPTRNMIIPYEKFMGRKVSYDHMKVFGCLAYWRINDTMRASKFDHKGQRMVFVGYSTTNKNYLLLDPKNSNVIKSCDVVFNEDKMGYPVIMGTESESPHPALAEHDYCKALSVTSDSSDLITYREALNSPDHIKWQQAIDKELNDLVQKGVYRVVDQITKTPLSTKWVLVKKRDGRYKARIVVRGFEQHNVDKTYAPTLQISSLKIVLTLALSRKMTIKQLDISTAFLYSKLQTDVYVIPPTGVNDKYWKLEKALYGLKEAPLAWYNTFKHFLIDDLKLKCSLVDPCVFFSDEIIMAVYVDDIIVAAKDENTTDRIIKMIQNKFDIHDFGDCKIYLGLNIKVSNECISIDQTKYIEEVLNEFNMVNSNSTLLPMDNLEDFSNYPIETGLKVKELLGSLNYIATRTRPDIAICVSHLGKFASKPSRELWTACKRVLRYLNGTKNLKMMLYPVKDWTIKTYTDASFRSDNDQYATSGAILLLDKSPIYWSSKKQQRLAHSTCEAELVAALDGWKFAEPIRQFIRELGIECKVNLLIDSSAAVSILDNNAFKRSRYFEYDQKVLVSKINNDPNLKVTKVSTSDQLADALTKPLLSIKLNYFVKRTLSQEGVLKDDSVLSH